MIFHRKITISLKFKLLPKNIIKKNIARESSKMKFIKVSIQSKEDMYCQNKVLMSVIIILMKAHNN